MKFRVAFLRKLIGLGIFWDQEKRVLRIFPIPLLMLKFSFNAARGPGRTKMYW